MNGQDSENLVLAGNVLPQDAVSIKDNGQLDAFGLGFRGRFDCDEDIQYEVILHGLRERAYVVVPVLLLNSSRTQNQPHVSARMLLLRQSPDSFERVGLFIFGSSFISFKLINLINEGMMSWNRETLKII